PDSPNMYTVVTELRDGDNVLDKYTSPLGFRTIVIDAKRGLFVNGQNMIMKGMCNHHDLGPLGTALWDQALERRLRMLKEMGCNAIRTAHNPPCPELLDFCNRMGFLVINETFDEWRRGWAFEDGTLVSSKNSKGKAAKGYHLYFDEWAEKDLIDHIRRDRNHPCVVMWSIGNEVPEAQKHGEIETVKILQDLCHKHDPTRLVTVGCNFTIGANKTGFLDILDVVGYNGGGNSCYEYENDKKKYPNRLMYASEVPHTLHTRGEYRTNGKFRIKKYQPAPLVEKEVFPETSPWYESSYDNAGVRITARDSWRLTKNLPYFFGEFRWTGFDYIGESGGWPRVIGNFGIIDICNFPKDTYYFYQSQWTKKPMVHMLPHWTMPGKEGTIVPVWCYTNCDSVALFLNGKSLGVRTYTKEMDMHMQWLVPYAPGELKAVAKKDGKVVATTTKRTAGPVANISLEADKTTFNLKGKDLSYITVRLEDKDGNFCPKADNWMAFSVKGPGRIIATGNGDPLSHESFQARSVRAFNGMALAIIAPTDEAGEITVTARPIKQTWSKPAVVKISAK
ncbi:MAG: glycoside hydrolase family 2 TIM barrel-domain containing protein, partial [Akkermansiaceae bacterium]